MNILNLAAQLSLDGTRFKAGLREAEVASTKFGSSVATGIKSQLAGAFGGASLVAGAGMFFKSAIVDTAALQDLSDQTKLSTDDVQRLKAAAEDMGLSFSDVASAQKGFDKNRREAGEGNEELIKSFAKFGMTLDDINNPSKGFLDFLESAAGAMGKLNMRDQATAGEELGTILGKMGPRLREFFQAAEDQRINEFVSPEAIKGLDAAGDRLAAFWRDVKGVAGGYVGGVLNFVRGENDPEDENAKRESRLAEITKARDKSKNEKLFTDKRVAEAAKVTKKNEEQSAKDAEKFEADKAKFNLKDMTPANQRAAIEEQLRQQMSVMGPVDQKQVLDLLGQLPAAQQFSRPAAASLTSVGQWSGRNFVNGSGGDSAVVKAAKDLLKPTQETAETLKSIDAKVVKGKTLNARL